MSYRFRAIIIFVSLLLWGCGDLESQKANFDKSQGEQTGQNGSPEVPSQRPVGGKGDLYRGDSRREFHEIEDETLKKVARATGVLKDIDSNRDNTSTLGESYNLCPGVKFRDQPTIGKCTGFLVGSDLFMSAGHCIETKEDCENTAFVFGYWYDSSDDESATDIATENIYMCDSIVAQSDERLDYGIYRLDTPVEDRPILSPRTAGKVPDNARLAGFGYPTGMPLKIVPQGNIPDNSPQNYFEHTLDTFGGSSGGPVINKKTGTVEGIHFAGGSEESFIEAEDRSCQIPVDCSEVERFSDEGTEYCGGEAATRSRLAFPDLPNWTTRETTEDFDFVGRRASSLNIYPASGKVGEIRLTMTIEAEKADQLNIELYRKNFPQRRAEITPQSYDDSWSWITDPEVSSTDMKVEGLKGEPMRGTWQLEAYHPNSEETDIDIERFRLSIRKKR